MPISEKTQWYFVCLSSETDPFLKKTFPLYVKNILSNYVIIKIKYNIDLFFTFKAIILKSIFQIKVSFETHKPVHLGNKICTSKQYYVCSHFAVLKFEQIKTPSCPIELK